MKSTKFLMLIATPAAAAIAISLLRSSLAQTLPLALDMSQAQQPPTTPFTPANPPQPNPREAEIRQAIQALRSANSDVEKARASDQLSRLFQPYIEEERLREQQLGRIDAPADNRNPFTGRIEDVFPRMVAALNETRDERTKAEATQRLEHFVASFFQGLRNRDGRLSRDPSHGIPIMVTPDGRVIRHNDPLEDQIRPALEQFRNAAGEAEKTVAKKQLTTILEQYFDEDLRRRAEDLARIEERVKNLRAQLDRRRDKKQEIIDLQIKVAENEADGLGFFSSPADANDEWFEVYRQGVPTGAAPVQIQMRQPGAAKPPATGGGARTRRREPAAAAQAPGGGFEDMFGTATRMPVDNRDDLAVPFEGAAVPPPGQLLTPAMARRYGVPGASPRGSIAPGQVIRPIPAAQAFPANAAVTQSQNNLKKIAIAMLNYESATRSYPPAASQPSETYPHPHSWRVTLLPYLGEEELYQQYQLNEPWDSPNNLRVQEAMPAVFRHPNDKPNSTTSAYFVLTGPGTVFDGGPRGAKLGQISDGTANTLLVVEAQRDIPWTKPVDIAYDANQPLPALGGWIEGQDILYAARCDGSILGLNAKDTNLLRAAITRAGREQIEW
jgi:hypothetical protein